MIDIFLFLINVIHLIYFASICINYGLFLDKYCISSFINNTLSERNSAILLPMMLRYVTANENDVTKLLLTQFLPLFSITVHVLPYV
jgi:hypothetical protein